MEEFNEVFDPSQMPFDDGLNDRFMTDDNDGRSTSFVLSMLTDKAEHFYYTARDCQEEKEFLDKLAQKRKSNTIVPKKVFRRRPGEFTEVDFPKVSSLTLNQMKFYTFLSKKPQKCMGEEAKNDLKSLRDEIAKEQIEYQEFARHQWTSNNYLRHKEIKPSVKKYVDDVWQCKIKRIHKYPKFYKRQKEMVPLTFNDIIDSENPVTLKMGPQLFSTGQHNIFILPPVNARFKEVTYLPTDYATLVENRHPAHEFLPPVSRDEIAEQLINEIDTLKNESTVVVLSGSSLKTILDNHQSDLCSNWMLPITVREYKTDGNKSRKAIFIDKKLPPKTLTIAERMRWYAKIAARMMMCKSSEQSEEDEHDDLSKMDHEDCNEDSEGSDNQWEDCNDAELSENHDVEESFCKYNERKKPSWGPGHREYRVWQIGKESQNPLMKNQVSQIKLLIRTRYDGFWERKNLRDQLYSVAAKLDYQCEYGADRLTLSECIRQWTDLHIRPGCVLKRARINPLTSEFMQLQSLNERNINTELQFIHGVNISLTTSNILYSVLSRLIQLTPGNYLLEHSQKNGAFCVLSSACEPRTPGSFDLHMTYPRETADAIAPLQAPYNPLDPNFRTNNCFYKSVLPLTFPPRHKEKQFRPPKLKAHKKKKRIRAAKKTSYKKSTSSY